jgi:polyhydroxyalkanoate synthesis regulator phasin
MIYIKNTTDAQVIFIDREVQSIDNITPITLDSNYYTKVEVDVIAQRTLEQSKEYTNNLANEYYDIAEEYIDSNIERLENRIDELENNGGGSSGGDTTELENRVTELENRAFNNVNSLENQIEALDNRVTDIENNGGDTTNLQEQIEANHTLIGYLEQVKVLNVSYGMTTEQFNTIFNNFKNINYKYLLNVGNNDFFEICSIQDANRSITAIGFDDYEGELMCYNWFAPNIASVPELTKRKIITEIV